LTFSPGDSQSIEKAYQKYIEDIEDEGQTAQSPIDLTTPDSKAGRKENSSLEGDESPRQPRSIKVPVNEDYLFDVDIEERELAPVYWLGPIYDVRRGTWFYQEGSTLRPCDENLATQLEEGYLKVKPFRYPKPAEKAAQPKAVDEAKLPAATGSSEVTPKTSAENLKGAEQTPSKPADVSHQPQTHRLFGSYMNSIVTYQDDTVAWLSDDSIVSRMSTTVYQRFAGGGYMSGVKIVRGYTKDDKTPNDTKTEVPSAPAPDVVEESEKAGLRLDERQQRLLKRRSAPAGTLRASDIRDIHAEEQKAASSGGSTPKSEEAAVRKLDEKEIRDDYQDHPSEDQSREIEHLVLVTHGIGQRLGMR